MADTKKKNRFWYFIMTIASWFFAVDYYMLILEGDQPTRRKIVLGFWVIMSIVWTVMSIQLIKSRKKDKEVKKAKEAKEAELSE